MADQWYVGRNGQKAGPYSTEQLTRMAASGQLVATDLLWKQGLENWVPCSQVKGLLPAAAASTLPPRADTDRASGAAFDLLDTTPAGPKAAPADWNPYESTSSAGLDAGSAEGIVYADFLRRVVATVLDGIFVGVICFALQFALMAVIVGVLGGNEAAFGIGNLVGIVLAFALQTLYFVGYETSSKQGTWGKQLLGIKVTDMEGRRITTGRALGRYFAKIITNLTCGIGYLLPLFSKKKQTIHDMISGCLALKK